MSEPAPPRDRGMHRAPSDDIGRPRVLIADDDPEMLEAMVSAVESLGAEVVRATSGGELIEHLADDEPYQLMITDIAMPWVNGLQVSHAARNSGLGLPIILITAKLIPDLQRQVNALGRDAVLLRKPFALRDLEAAVLAMLGRTEPAPPAPASAS